MQQFSGFYSQLTVYALILCVNFVLLEGLLCHCDPCQGGGRANGTCLAPEGRRCFAAYTKKEGRERTFYGCTRTLYALNKCEDRSDPTSVMECCDEADLCNYLLKPTLPPPTAPPVPERKESKTIQVMRIVAIVSGPICVLYTLIMVVVCVTRIQRKRRNEELRRIYGYTPHDHELLPTSTQLLRQQAAAAAESSNSADSGIGGEESRSPIYIPPPVGEESRTPIYTAPSRGSEPTTSPSQQQLLSDAHSTAETLEL